MNRGLRQMADVQTSLVGENGITGREKLITGGKKVSAGIKMYCAHNDLIHPEHQ